MDVGKTVGAIYYTDFHADANLMKVCQEQILRGFKGEIISVSLRRPLYFGKNIVLNESRSYPTMALQILTALKASTCDYVFFLEHDVLYHPSHFDFIPYNDKMYYYNVNNYRWKFGEPIAITYDELTSLSALCCNRELAIKHYTYRLKLIEEQGLDKMRSREPRWARRFGYEPGTKKTSNGGVTDEEHVKRRSEFPNVDVRHRYTFSQPKVTRESFKHVPETFKEIPIEDIEGWNLRELFDLKI